MAYDSAADCVIALTTLGSLEEARALVRRLVDSRVVACGTVLAGAVSIYRWEGKVTESSEAVVLLKTQRERWEDLLEAVKRDHPYEVPELLQIPVQAGLDRYLEWVRAETATTEGRRT
ncbi:Divalent-cation tolerance protein CutA [bacterium HR33]|nr:Divalent-cation tolerance protein CutA [bacterium HR33]